jgi:hypothetical protein
MVTNPALLVAVHVQPLAAVIGTEPVPPAGPYVDALIAPATTLHDGVLGDAGDSSFEQPNAATSRMTAAISRREVVMRGAYTESGE